MGPTWRRQGVNAKVSKVLFNENVVRPKQLVHRTGLIWSTKLAVFRLARGYDKAKLRLVESTYYFHASASPSSQDRVVEARRERSMLVDKPGGAVCDLDKTKVKLK